MSRKSLELIEEYYRKCDTSEDVTTLKHEINLAVRDDLLSALDNCTGFASEEINAWLGGTLQKAERNLRKRILGLITQRQPMSVFEQAFNASTSYIRSIYADYWILAVLSGFYQEYPSLETAGDRYWFSIAGRVAECAAGMSVASNNDKQAIYKSCKAFREEVMKYTDALEADSIITKFREGIIDQMVGKISA